MIRLLLVRHGQSEWNADGRWQGQADPPLTELGRTQARHAAAALGAVDAIVSSPLDRAAETAAIISAELGIGPVLTEDDLQERHAGEFAGLTRDEIEVAYPGYLADGRRPPGWEDDDALLERVSGAIGRIAATIGDGDVLVVTHGGVVMNLEGHLGTERHRLPNLSGRWLEVRDDGTLVLGERLDLLTGAELTVPDQI
ncbi:MAG TPA: histidine phosphatase family protein [Microthrixaceae bacterium]|nr:histidine phosphatase family protein [Microthrixaceae bacterium]